MDTDKEFTKAQSYAVWRLARYNQNTFLLTRALRDKLYSEETIAKVIEKCKHLGFLNDSEWLQNFIRNEIVKKTGPQQIVRKLISKGIHYATAQEAVEAQTSDEIQNDQITKLLKTRYRTKDRNKTIAALMRKGFSWDAIRQALEDYEHGHNGQEWTELDELD